MKARSLWVILAGLSGLALLAPNSIAQVSTSMQATATVVSSLTVTSSNDLEFGNVTPGVNKTVDHKTSADAGLWSIQGSGAAEVQLSFTSLPGQLTTGTENLSVSYTASVGTVQSTSVDIPILAAGATDNLVGGSLDVWIGGTVYPGASQPDGDYSATLTLEVTLTGN
jgi:hypothetical protein